MEQTIKEIDPASLRQDRRLAMSYAQFRTQIDETVHAEWVDGETIVFMPPTATHQDAVTFLVTLLRMFAQFFGVGQVLTAPYEMKIVPDGNAREPDILFVSQEHAERITESKLEGPADLVVEVISDSSVARDRGDKFYEYQDGGVREYWIIDPRPGHERADFWVLDADGRYQPVPIDDDGIYRSTVLADFWLDVGWLWMDNAPDPLRAFAQIAGPDAVIAALRQMTDNAG